MKDLDHSDKGRCSVCDRSRPFQYFYSFDVRKVEIGNGGVERAAERYAVDDKQKSVELVQTPEGGYGACRARIASRRRLDARDQSKRAAQIDNLSSAKFLARNQADRFWRPSDIFWQPRSGHHDLVSLGFSTCGRERERKCDRYRCPQGKPS